MFTELESAKHAQEDDLARAFVSIIVKTRRHWASAGCLTPEVGVGIGYARPQGIRVRDERSLAIPRIVPS